MMKIWMQAQLMSMKYEKALEKCIHILIQKVNVANIRIVTKELLKVNIGRHRAFLVSSVIEAQNSSPTLTNVYAALVAVINSRIPNIGWLVLRSLVGELNIKSQHINSYIIKALFIAHLVNQRVVHATLAVQLLTLLVKKPTEVTVDVAIAFLKECGQQLTEVSYHDVNAIFGSLKNILLQGQLSNNVQCKIEVMLQVWKDGLEDHPILIKELEVVPEEEQFTHDACDVLNFELSFSMTEKFGIFYFIPTLKSRLFGLMSAMRMLPPPATPHVQHQNVDFIRRPADADT